MIDFHETAPSGPTAQIAMAMQALIPVIETERLRLRAPRIEDFDAFANAVSGPRGQYYGDYDDREGAWADFIQLTGTWLLRGHGAWTVTDKTTHAVLGLVQIGAEPGDQEPELGFIVSQEAEGKSVAFEAAKAVRDHGFGAFKLPSLVSYVDAQNARSAALARRLGAQRDKTAEAGFPKDDRPLVFRHQPQNGAHA